MNLKEARRSKNMSQVELAKKIGVTVLMISLYENNRSIPRPATRKKIEQVLGLVDWPTERTQHLKVPTLIGGKT